MLCEVRKYRFVMLAFFCGLCVLGATLSLSACHPTSKHLPADRDVKIGDVTLLWNDIPGAVSYNVYVSRSPGVTKHNGYKIPDVTNPVRINQLEPGKTHYFVVTVVDEAGESKESKELSYDAAAGTIGLVYWESLFDESMQDRSFDTAEALPENETRPEGMMAEPGSEAQENSVRRDQHAGDDKPPGALAAVNPPSSRTLTETAAVEENQAEGRKPKAVSIASLNDSGLPEAGEMRPGAARMAADSQFYIFFEHNSNELSPRAIEKLDRIYAILSENPGAKLTLNGYSDSSGAPSFNQMVSEVRANSVKSYLSGKGIRSSRMRALGHGAQNALASNQSAEGRRLNRRVEIEVIMP